MVLYSCLVIVCYLQSMEDMELVIYRIETSKFTSTFVMVQKDQPYPARDVCLYLFQFLCLEYVAFVYGFFFFFIFLFFASNTLLSLVSFLCPKAESTLCGCVLSLFEWFFVRSFMHVYA